MFRDGSNVKLDTDNFSVGSIMNLMGAMYLVISDNSNNISLLDLNTFIIEDNIVNVTDCNHLTVDDARSIMKHMQVTFSDFSENAKGLKNFNYKKQLGVTY